MISGQQKWNSSCLWVVVMANTISGQQKCEEILQLEHLGCMSVFDGEIA